MFWQRELFRDHVGMPFGQTYEVDLPEFGNLGSVGLVFRSNCVANASLAIEKWRLIDYISKIELIGDGATVIKSFDGRQSLACNYYDDHVIPFSQWRNYAACPQRQAVVLNLGRHVHDLTHYLDMSRFTQVKLRITNDATAVEYATDVNLDVILHWLREPTTPSMGYYREEEWKLWSPAASAIEYTNLPTELKIRRILLRGRPGVDAADCTNNTTMIRLMDPIDFSLRTGQTRVYRGSLDVLGRMSHEELGYQPETYGEIARTTLFSFDVGLGYVNGFLAAPQSQVGAIGAYPLTMVQDDVNDGSQLSVSYAVNYPLNWQAKGFGYMYNVPLFDSDDPEDADVLDPEVDKVVKVDITCLAGTNVAGTNHVAQNAIILSRLVP